MNPNNSFPPRRSMRLPEFDYSQPGAYFVTIVTQDRKSLFGQIVDGEMVLNELGKAVADVWVEIPEHFPNVELGEFVVMPNHVHGIVIITVEATQASNVAARHAVPMAEVLNKKFAGPVPAIVEATHASPLPSKLNGPIPGSLGAIIGSFKSAATKRDLGLIHYEEKTLWQRNYYEHVIRNEKDHQAIYDYILTNPINWEKDEENLKE